MDSGIRRMISVMVVAIAVITIYAPKAGAVSPQSSRFSFSDGLEDISIYLSSRELRNWLDERNDASYGGTLDDLADDVVSEINGRLEQYNVSYVILRMDEDPYGYKHLRLSQRTYGVPVRGGELVVHLDSSDRLFSIRGKINVAYNGILEPQIGIELKRR
jgi:Zn-dependent metalloprotease